MRCEDLIFSHIPFPTYNAQYLRDIVWWWITQVRCKDHLVDYYGFTVNICLWQRLRL